jgi:hypothetical protein
MYLQCWCCVIVYVYTYNISINRCVLDVPAMFPCSAKWVVMEFLVQPAATPHSVLHTVPRLRTPHAEEHRIDITITIAPHCHSRVCVEGDKYAPLTLAACGTYQVSRRKWSFQIDVSISATTHERTRCLAKPLLHDLMEIR